MEFKRPTAVAVTPLPLHRLLITFSNNERRLFDVAPYLSDAFFAPLAKPGIFHSVHINPITVEWYTGSGEIDICPDELYYNSVPYKQ